MAKQLDLRRDDECVRCGLSLPRGTRAFWDSERRAVSCLSCPSTRRAGEELLESSAGASAQAEYEKRSTRERARKQLAVDQDAEWRVEIKENRPVIGRLAAALTPKPRTGPESQSTSAWKVGAEGERRVAETLSDIAGIEVLHDRLMPRSKANIDHLVVGPAGIFVVDAKKYTGRVERRDVGNIIRAEARLYVNGRDRSKLIDGLEKQSDAVRGSFEAGSVEVDVHQVLCFVGSEWGMLRRPVKLRQTIALWPTALADHVTQPGPWAADVPEVARHLRAYFAPAS